MAAVTTKNPNYKTKRHDCVTANDNKAEQSLGGQADG